MENVECASVTVKEDIWIGKAMQWPEGLGPTWPDAIQIWWRIGLWLLCVKIITYALTFACGSCVYTSVWVRAKEAVLSSNCQASWWDEDAMSDVAPASHAPVGLNKHYIRLKPEPAWRVWLTVRTPNLSSGDGSWLTSLSDHFRLDTAKRSGREFWWECVTDLSWVWGGKSTMEIIGDKSSNWNMDGRLIPY